jgi:hypothetical protein
MNNESIELLHRVFAVNEQIVKQNYQIMMVLCNPRITKSNGWKELFDEEIEIGLLASNYSMLNAGAWRDGVEWAKTRIKEKNNV